MNQSIVSAHIGEVRLESAPIRTEWVLDGAPRARAAELSRSADSASMTAVWDCTAGTFNWFFGGDETVHILEGEVIVDDGAGPRTLRPGDAALFRAGTWARWHVPVYVRKLAFCHDALPRPLSLGFAVLRKARRGRDKLLRLLGLPAAAGGFGSGPARPGTVAAPSRRLFLFSLRAVGFSFGLVL